MRYVVLLVCASLLTGCGDDGAPAPGTSSTSSGAAGADPGCAPGELLLSSGVCQPAGLPPDFVEPIDEPPSAGVPPDACGSGFLPEANGCTPVLPDLPCAAGTMAIPGETDCRPVALCAAGTWGDIPVEASTQYVDGSFAGTSDGSAASPWTTLQEAVDAAPAGAIVAVASGSYAGVTIDTKAVRLWGRCPDLVEIVGNAAASSAVRIDGAAAAELHSVAVRGLTRGVLALDAPGVVIDRVWFHDLANTGVQVQATAEPGVTVTGTLVESVAVDGILLFGSSVRVEESVVRDVDAGTGLYLGHGVDATDDGPRSHLVLTSSVITNVVGAGVTATGTDLEADAIVVRGVAPAADDQSGGMGIYVVDDSGERSSATIRTSFIAETHAGGIRAVGSDLVVDRTVVREVLPNQNDGLAGFGIAVIRGDDTGAEATGVIHACLVADTHNAGIAILGAQATVDATRVSDTMAIAPRLDETSGIGVTIEASGRGVAADAVIHASVFERSHSAGILCLGSTLALEGSAVLDTAAASDGTGGTCLLANGGATVDVESSLFSGCLRAGIELGTASAMVEGSRIRDVAAEVASGGLGAGVIVGHGDSGPGSLVIRNSTVENVHAGGVMAFGAPASLEAVHIRDVHANGVIDPLSSGISIVDHDDVPSVVDASQCLVEEIHAVGLLVYRSDAHIEGVAVRNVLPDENEEAGIGIAVGGGARRGALQARGCAVTETHTAGAYADASDISFEKVLVAGVRGRASDGDFGRAIGLQNGATGILTDCAVKDAREVGVDVRESTATLKRTVVESIAPRLSDGGAGDGVDVGSLDGEADVVIDSCVIRDVTRAGIANFGSHAALVHTTLECDPISLDGEEVPGHAPHYEDLGGNLCKCASAVESCRVLSANLSAPDPLPP